MVVENQDYVAWSKSSESSHNNFNPFPNKLWFLHVQYKSFENTVENGEFARNVFSTCLENFLQFSSTLILSSANSFSLEESKICGLGNS